MTPQETKKVRRIIRKLRLRAAIAKAVCAKVEQLYSKLCDKYLLK